MIPITISAANKLARSTRTRGYGSRWAVVSSEDEVLGSGETKQHALLDAARRLDPVSIYVKPGQPPVELTFAEVCTLEGVYLAAVSESAYRHLQKYGFDPKWVTVERDGVYLWREL